LSYEAEIRERARAMRTAGMTLRAIATALESNRSTIAWLCSDIPHRNRRRTFFANPKEYPNCWQCGGALAAHGRFCRPCRYQRARHSGREAAAVAVKNAIRAGLLQPPRGQTCADCPRPAEEYDHRDYSKPLDVQAVCRRCNARRGPGKWVQFKPIRDLIAERAAA
jgi:hypothetical protein